MKYFNNFNYSDLSFYKKKLLEISILSIYFKLIKIHDKVIHILNNYLLKFFNQLVEIIRITGKKNHITNLSFRNLINERRNKIKCKEIKYSP